MAAPTTPVYRFGDLLALARRSWTQRMAFELARRGYRDYRISDAATVRLLRARPLSIGELGEVLGITRQAARKVTRYLEDRGYATTAADSADGRKVNVVLTRAGRAYARTVAEVIALLNQALAERVSRDELVAADVVLRAILDDHARTAAQRIPAPDGGHVGLTS